MMAQNGTVRPSAVQVRDVVRVVLEADGNGNVKRLCCSGRVWGEEGEVEAGLRVDGVDASAKREREGERVQSCLMGLAQQQQDGRGYGFEGEDGEEGDVEGGAAEAPDVPRERVRTEGVSGSVSRGWKKAFGRVR